MSTCYILPIGGSGTRVMRALFHLLASGGFDDERIKSFDNYKVMCIDSDGNNGDMNGLRSLYSKYKALQKLTDLPLVSCYKEDGGLYWSPLDSNDNDMRGHIGDFNLNDDAKNVLEFLYTKEELSKKLNEGFYGHTSIGSYFTSLNILGENHKFSEVWERYFEHIGDGDKIFIVGSVFGGTGASGIPTIARIIKNNIKEDVPIGAVLVMPYFRPVGKQGEKTSLNINWRTFNSKVKMALSFYESQGFDDIFRTMYFIGENEENFMNVPYSEGGGEQKNKPHYIETYAAATLFDFLAAPKNDTFRTKFYVIEQKADEYIIPETLNNVVKNANIVRKMSTFFLFSSLYTKLLSDMIENRKKNIGWLKNYESVYGRNFLKSHNFNVILKDYCEEYLSWIWSQLILPNDSGNIRDDSGIFDYKINSKVKWLNVSDMYGNLYNPETVSCGFTGYKFRELENMATVVFNESPESENKRYTGQRIIEELATNTVKPITDSMTTFTVFMRDVMELCGREVEN
ncbi:MAG: hypothetical protein HFE59_07395 [Clostridiales bacterium]|nr:hypothetical protein [Clostridiales bacterium]